MVLVFATTSCHEGDVTAPPLIDWDQIVVATVGPTPPTSNDPDTCTDMYEAWENEEFPPEQQMWDDCEGMSNNLKDLILAHFEHEDFRSGDLNCQDLKSKLTSALGAWDTRARGGGSISGLSYVANPQGVWFNEAFSSWSIEEQRRAAAHEAYHLAFPDDGDDENAELAAAYCFGETEEHPWGPE